MVGKHLSAALPVWDDRTLFLSFSILAEPGMCSLGSRTLKQIKAKKVTELKESLAMGKKSETVTKYFIVLFTVEAQLNYYIPKVFVLQS